jgi:plasmid maintenance system antidote protein VapI
MNLEKEHLDNVRKELKEKLLTRTEMASQMDVEYSYLTRFLNGAPIGKDVMDKVEDWLFKHD